MSLWALFLAGLMFGANPSLAQCPYPLPTEFGCREELSAGGEKYLGLAIADFDGDSLLDIATGPMTEPRLLIYRQDRSTGFDRFAPATEYPLGFAAGGFTIEAADMNLDGHPDLVIGSGGWESDCKIQILWNDPGAPGTCSSGPLTVLSTSSIVVFDLAAADFDGDSMPEILATAAVNGHELFYLDYSVPGDSFDVTLLETYTPLNTAQPTGLVAEDLNGDGCPDFIVAAGEQKADTSSIEVWLNRCDSSPVPFDSMSQRVSFGLDLYFPRLGDLNNDGLTDLIIGDHNDDSAYANHGIYYLLNTGTTFTPSFAPPVLIKETMNQGVGEVALYDFDCDGDLDVAATQLRSLTITFWSNTSVGGGGALFVRDTMMVIDTLIVVDENPTRLEAVNLYNGPAPELVYGNNNTGRAAVLAAGREMHGDLDASAFRDAVDVSLLIDVVFFGAAAPMPAWRSDVNCNKVPDSVDVACLIDHVFFGSDLPCQ